MTASLSKERSQPPITGVARAMRFFKVSAGLALATFLLLTAAFTPTAASAQTAAARPIFLALPDRFPDVDARVVLVRERGREFVVLDPEAATADELIMGLRLLNQVRRERPEPENGEFIPILGFYPPTLAAEERARLEGIIAELRRQPTVSIGSLGRGRWIPYIRR